MSVVSDGHVVGSACLVGVAHLGVERNHDVFAVERDLVAVQPLGQQGDNGDQPDGREGGEGRHQGAGGR